jgi:ubiquinone/menaquinone biosynthesis C-methylase UbiE
MSNDFQLLGDAAVNFNRFVQVIMLPFVEPILQRAHLQEGKSVLDIGCGTGFFTRAAREKVGLTGSTVGLDPNGPMLEVAAALSTDAELPIDWCEASVDDMEFGDSKFDAVISTQTIMFFPNLEQGIRKICSVMAPGGRMAASFWAGPLERSPYMAAHNYRLEEIIPGMLELSRHAFRLDEEEVATMFRNSGLQEVTAETIELPVALPPIKEFLPLHIAGLPFATDFAALEKSVQETLYAEVNKDLAAYIQSDGSLLVPFTLHLVSGRKT